MLQNIQVKELHFAWDMQRHERAVLAGLRRYLESDPHKRHGAYATVYMLTNYDTEHDYDLVSRIYFARYGVRPLCDGVRQAKRTENNTRLAALGE